MRTKKIKIDLYCLIQEFTFFMTRKQVSPETATGAVLQKNIFLKIWQNLQENT